jgi:hypothetical protein
VKPDIGAQEANLALSCDGEDDADQQGKENGRYADIERRHCSPQQSRQAVDHDAWLQIHLVLRSSFFAVPDSVADTWLTDAGDNHRPAVADTVSRHGGSGMLL